MFKTVFGIECPSCGLQRACLCLLQGEVLNAFSVWPPLLGLLLFFALSVGKLLEVKKISNNILKNGAFVCLIMILISYLSKLFLNYVN